MRRKRKDFGVISILPRRSGAQKGIKAIHPYSEDLKAIANSSSISSTLL